MICAIKQHMRAFCTYTRKRFERTHGGVWNLHMECLSLSPLLLSFSRPFFFLSSLVLFLRSLPLLSSLLSSLFSLLFSSLPATMTTITRQVGSLSLSVHTALTCQSVRVRGLRSIPCLANMFASCKEQLSWHNCASLVPLRMKWACICAGNG